MMGIKKSELKRCMGKLEVKIEGKYREAKAWNDAVRWEKKGDLNWDGICIMITLEDRSDQHVKRLECP